MKVETRKVVVLDAEDKVKAKQALQAALYVRNQECKSEEEGNTKMDTIISFLNSIIDNID